MNIDVAGRVKNVQLPSGKPLLPLFEAIINSLHAIEDANEPNGIIEVKVVRDSNSLFSQTDQQLADITSFLIIDNGIGFDEANFEAFSTSDTTYKANRGGKGVGRFMWLQAFDSVDINSVYHTNGEAKERKFKFCPTGTGIDDHTLTTEQEDRERKTIVKLIGLKDKFRKQCPKGLETVATYIVEEFLDYFLGPIRPVMILSDESTGEKICLDEFYDKVMCAQSEIKKITIEENDFEIVHVRLYSNHIIEHRLYFCAHGRSVMREKLSGIPNMVRRFVGQDGKEFVYAVYVNSSVLDEAVNADRTGFNLADDDSDLLATEFTLTDIREKIRDHCEEFLKPYTEPIASLKKDKIHRFIQEEGAMYRPLLKRLEPSLDFIDPEASNRDIDQYLYKEYQKLQVELKEEGRALLESSTLEENEFEKFKDRLNEYFEKISEINRADLARYVFNRKAILEFLQKQLTLQVDGKYKHEGRIHSIIFPQGKTSEELLYEEHNLWLVDERLAFHVYLSSDKPIKKASILESKSGKEPDILVFDKAISFTDSPDQPFTSITIIEFKKPLREEYSEKENPFRQIYTYINEIREGKAKTHKGRPITIPPNLPFYCYIICDLTPKLQEWARQFGLQGTPDALGFFGYNQNFNAYTEVISYNKLVVDAQKRNQAFFTKLGLPDQIHKDIGE